MTPEACRDCLRRSALVGFLAPQLAAVLDRPRRRSTGVLALGEEDLIAAVAGSRADDARRFVAQFDPDRARRGLVEAGVLAACRHGEGYPPGLVELDDPPSTAYAGGRLERLPALADVPAVAIVGARRASSYALEVAYELGRGLGAAGVRVVSGLALGVDAAAHRGALDGGGTPIGVLACGVDVPYPRTNRPLYERVRADGLVLSELPPGQPPFRWSFPARNRIMAALADLTVVVEAAESSGSLITAAFAQDLGRDVAVVPGRVTSRLAAGGNRLLRDGATVVRGAEDVLDDLFGVGARRGSDREGASGRSGQVAGATAAQLEPELRSVLDAVETGEGIAAIGREAGLAPGTVRGALGRLEVLGLVARDGFGGYERTARP